MEKDPATKRAEMLCASAANAFNPYNPRPRVLLVEDYPILQFVQVKILQTLGCCVVLAKTGEEAIELFKANQKYDLVLLDIQLPGISGKEVAKSIRALEEPTRHTPLVALTVFDKDIQEDCFAAGMDDFYVKPALTEDFKIILNKWIKSPVANERIFS